MEMGVSILSKKRFKEIRDLLQQSVKPDELEKVLDGICAIMKFDPEEKNYTPQRGKQIMANRKKRAEALGHGRVYKREEINFLRVWVI